MESETKQSKGGDARSEALTPEQRKEIASKAAKARWTPESTAGKAIDDSEAEWRRLEELNGWSKPKGIFEGRGWNKCQWNGGCNKKAYRVMYGGLAAWICEDHLP